MDTSCNFFQDFVPTAVAPDVAVTHLKNCADCQEETVLVSGSESAWGVESA